MGILRKELQAYGNLRPVFFISSALVAVSPLKPEICRDADLMIIRELNGGIYYGRREEPNANLDVASDLDLYTRGEVERITRLAGALAMSHDPPLKVTSLDKANLLAAAGRLWRGVVSETLAREFPLVQLKHLLIDSAAMVMVKNPSSLNGIILTSNMFGDIISDEASVIPGSLGLMPSASLCGVPSPDANTRVRGLYEPIHGKPFKASATRRLLQSSGLILVFYYRISSGHSRKRHCQSRRHDLVSCYDAEVFFVHAWRSQIYRIGCTRRNRLRDLYTRY